MDHRRLSSGDIASANPISNLPPGTPICQVPSAVLRKRRLSELEDADAAMLPPKHDREGEADSFYIGTETLSRSMPSFQCTHSAKNGPARCGPENTYEVQPGGGISSNLLATGDIGQGWCPDRIASIPLSGEVQSSNLQLSVPTVRQALPDQYMHQQLISQGFSGNFDTVASDGILCINPSILEKRVGEGNDAVSADVSGRSSILCDIWASVYREVPGAQTSLGHQEDLPSLTIPSELEAGGKSGSSLHTALSMRAQNTSLPPDPGAGSGILANCSSNTTHPLLIAQST
ncbi:hypothetical protein KXX32_000889 [Aspergillus fumigatus]|nr:hypothetical protein KXX32_000889 [Aspergillus fumigatus]